MAFTQVTDILREGRSIIDLIAEPTVADNHERTQETHHMFDPPFTEKVVTNTEIRMDEIACAEQESEPCSIHDNVAMVSHKESTLADVLLDLLLITVVL